jgi:hypothetical protein
MSTPPTVEINRYTFTEEHLKEVRANNFAQSYWPLVYVLSDDHERKAYVGETADAASRISTHLKHNDKQKLSVVHLIASSKFNKSATLDKATV